MRGTSRAVSVVKLEFDRYGIIATECSAFNTRKEAQEAMNQDYLAELKGGEHNAEYASANDNRAFIEWKDKKPMHGGRIEWSVHGGDEDQWTERIRSRISEVSYVVNMEIPARELGKWEDLLSSEKVDYDKEGIEPESCLWRATAYMPDGMQIDFKVCSGDGKADWLYTEAVLYDPKKAIPISRTDPESDLSGKWNMDFYDETSKVLHSYTVNIIPLEGDENDDKDKESKQDQGEEDCDK